MHNACIGAGVHFAAAVDIRLCTEDCWFTLKEVELGMFNIIFNLCYN